MKIKKLILHLKMLNIIKKTLQNKSKFFLSLLVIYSCGKDGNITSDVYKHGKKIGEYNGLLFTTKYGGINYYLSNKTDENEMLQTSDIDSIILYINEKKYVAEPLLDKAYSRERNNSDFSFFINEKDNRIVVDSIGKLGTILFFSEKTNMESLKKRGEIKSEYLEK